MKQPDAKPLQPRTIVESRYSSECRRCGATDTFLIDNQCSGGCTKERTKEITRGKQGSPPSRSPNSLVINIYDDYNQINIKRKN